MQVDFNNVRTRALHQYNALIQEIQDLAKEHRISVDDYLYRRLDRLSDELRTSLCIIGGTEVKGNPEFADVLGSFGELLSLIPEEEIE